MLRRVNKKEGMVRDSGMLHDIVQLYLILNPKHLILFKDRYNLIGKRRFRIYCYVANRDICKVRNLQMYEISGI